MSAPETPRERRPFRWCVRAARPGPPFGRHLRLQASQSIVRNETVPPPAVPLAQLGSPPSKPLPSVVNDPHRGGVARGQEADGDLGGIALVPRDVPQIGEPVRRLPGEHLSPLVLQARICARRGAARSRSSRLDRPSGCGRAATSLPSSTPMSQMRAPWSTPQ